MRTYLRSLSCIVFTSTVIGGILAAGPVTAAGAAVTGDDHLLGYSVGTGRAHRHARSRGSAGGM